MKRRSLAGVGFVAVMFASSGVSLSLTGCESSDDGSSQYVKRLDDPKEAEAAVTRLEELGDPSAIEGLGEAWKKSGRPVRYLQVIISLARPLTAKEAKAKYLDQYAEAGRPASWNLAMPYLKEALKADENNDRQIESAMKAADAIGEAKLEDGLDALIGLVTEKSEIPSPKKGKIWVGAIRAMGKFDGQKAKAAAVLHKLIEQPAPEHPRVAKDPKIEKADQEVYSVYLAIIGASINSLGELRNPGSAKTLVLALYKSPELFAQTRRALVATGPGVKDALRSVLRGQNQEVNDLFAQQKLDKYCGYKRPVECQTVSAKDFYAAVVLGDFYDPQVAPDLLDALKRPAAPVYFEERTEKGETFDQPSPNTQYNAIFDALRKIGAAEAAPTVRALWSGKSTPAPAPKKGAKPSEATSSGEPDIATKVLAVSAYPYLVRDDTGVEELGAIAANNGADDSLRQEAATAFARLSHNAKDVAVLETLAEKYFKASAEKAKEAAGDPKKKSEAAEDEYKKATDTHKKIADASAEAKSAALKIARDGQAKTEDIQAAAVKAKEAGDLLKKADDDFKKAKKTHREAQAPYKNLDNASKAYKGFARMFQMHVARIEVAIRCGGLKDEAAQIDCYAKSLDLSPEDEAKNCTSYIKDIGTWTDDEKLGLKEGAIERSMLELGKRGQKVPPKYTELLLNNAKSDDRLIRQSILLALPKVAKVPCDTCEDKLAKAIKAGEGKTTIADLNLETTMLRNYFSWAGGRTPGSKSAAATDDTIDTPATPTSPSKGPPPKKDPPAKKKGK